MHYLQKELYDLLQEDVSIFEFLQSGSLDGIWYWDLENPDHEWMSEQFWENFGFDASEKKHLVREWQDLINPEDFEEAQRLVGEHIADPEVPYSQILRYTKKDGSLAWVRCRGMVIRNADGKPIRMLGAHNDVTGLKNIELSLRAQIARVEELNRHMVDREKKMIKLKQRIKHLEDELASLKGA